MFVDALCLLSDAQAVTTDVASTNSYDLGNITPKRDAAIGDGMCLAFAADVAADFTTGNEVYEFQCITSAAADLGTPTIVCLRTILATDLLIGALFYLPIPGGAGLTWLRYLGAFYNTGGTTPTLTVTCFLTPISMIQSAKPAYASGWTVLAG